METRGGQVPQVSPTPDISGDLVSGATIYFERDTAAGEKLRNVGLCGATSLVVLGNERKACSSPISGKAPAARWLVTPPEPSF